MLRRAVSKKDGKKDHAVVLIASESQAGRTGMELKAVVLMLESECCFVIPTLASLMACYQQEQRQGELM